MTSSELDLFLQQNQQLLADSDVDAISHLRIFGGDGSVTKTEINVVFRSSQFISLPNDCSALQQALESHVERSRVDGLSK